ncbi:MAG TPA: hypothetical protein VLT84_01990 [Acidobacteriota bacterium]|nr:hypothetical protein [Acidobacteriota bacterium]
MRAASRRGAPETRRLDLLPTYRPAPSGALIAAFLCALAWPSPSRGAPGVIVAEATRISFPLTVEALGTTLANESVEIRPQVSEALTKIHFTDGQFVARGERPAEPAALATPEPDAPVAKSA